LLSPSKQKAEGFFLVSSRFWVSLVRSLVSLKSKSSFHLRKHSKQGEKGENTRSNTEKNISGRGDASRGTQGGNAQGRASDPSSDEALRGKRFPRPAGYRARLDCRNRATEAEACQESHQASEGWKALVKERDEMVKT